MSTYLILPSPTWAALSKTKDDCEQIINGTRLNEVASDKRLAMHGDNFYVAFDYAKRLDDFFYTVCCDRFLPISLCCFFHKNVIRKESFF